MNNSTDRQNYLISEVDESSDSENEPTRVVRLVEPPKKAYRSDFITYSMMQIQIQLQADINRLVTTNNKLRIENSRLEDRQRYTTLDLQTEQAKHDDTKKELNDVRDQLHKRKLEIVLLRFVVVMYLFYVIVNFFQKIF